MAVARIVALALLALPAAPSRAQEADAGMRGYVTLATGYWRHGLEQNDGATLELGFDYEHPTGAFVGAATRNLEYPLEYSVYRPREHETDVYAGFHRRTNAWSLTLSVGRYLFGGAAASYDYPEASVAFGVRDRVFYTVTYSGDFYGRGRTAFGQEASAVLPLPFDAEIGAAIGTFEVRNRMRHTYWDLGVSKLLGRFAVDLRYYDGGYGTPTALGDAGGTHVVASVSYALRKRRVKI